MVRLWAQTGARWRKPTRKRRDPCEHMQAQECSSSPADFVRSPISPPTTLRPLADGILSFSEMPDQGPRSRTLYDVADENKDKWLSATESRRYFHPETQPEMFPFLAAEAMVLLDRNRGKGASCPRTRRFCFGQRFSVALLPWVDLGASLQRRRQPDQGRVSSCGRAAGQLPVRRTACPLEAGAPLRRHRHPRFVPLPTWQCPLPKPLLGTPAPSSLGPSPHPPARAPFRCPAVSTQASVGLTGSCP